MHKVKFNGKEKVLHFGINAYIGSAILLLPMGLFAFLLNKLFVFNSVKETNN